jgi:hypothetical protein
MSVRLLLVDPPVPQWAPTVTLLGDGAHKLAVWLHRPVMHLTFRDDHQRTMSLLRIFRAGASCFPAEKSEGSFTGVSRARTKMARYLEADRELDTLGERFGIQYW